MMFSCQQAKKQEVIIPNNYWGWFAIVYDCKCGEDKVLENNKLQQEIPDNGILLVNYPRPKGAVNVNVYRDKGSTKELLLRIEPQKNKKVDSLSFSNLLSHYSFNEVSKCDPSKGKHYDHTIVFYRVDKEKEQSDKDLEVFKKRLKAYLSSVK